MLGGFFVGDGEPGKPAQQQVVLGIVGPVDQWTQGCQRGGNLSSANRLQDVSPLPSWNCGHAGDLFMSSSHLERMATGNWPEKWVNCPMCSGHIGPIL